MRQSVTVLIGILIIGASARVLNGPWLINSIQDALHIGAPPKSLSPVIFGMKFVEQSRDISKFRS